MQRITGCGFWKSTERISSAITLKFVEGLLALTLSWGKGNWMTERAIIGGIGLLLVSGLYGMAMIALLQLIRWNAFEHKLSSSLTHGNHRIHLRGILEINYGDVGVANLQVGIT